MRCEEVRQLLPEHLLGSPDEPEQLEIGAHLRGCVSCRGERAALEEGLDAFSRAAHDLEPPTALRERVLATMSEEWRDSSLAKPARRHSRRPAERRRHSPLLAAAAVILALVAAGSIVWGRGQAHRLDLVAEDARSYQGLLAALGGRDFRVGKLSPAAGADVGGRVVVYDGDPAAGWSSWAVVIVRVPGRADDAAATLIASDGKRILLPPLRFEAGGEASTWLVTRGDLKPYDRITISSSDGAILASTTLAEA
jgi:putative zinc finger protein